VSLNLDIPDSPRLRDKLAATCLFILVFAALAAGIWIGSTRAPVKEDISAAPAVRQADGSLELARMPDAKPPPPPHQIPRGTTEVRRITTTIKPTVAAGCEPVTVTTSIVRDGNGLRAITSADNGTVIAGADVPIVALNLSPPPLKWGAEAMYEPVHGLYGARLSRRVVGRLAVSASLLQRERGGIAPWIGVQINF
jgi:hypothetical protein